MKRQPRRTIEAVNMGDIDFLTYGGFFAWKYTQGGHEYTDLIWFDRDEDTDDAPYRVYCECLEKTHDDEWYWDDIDSVAACVGMDPDEFKALATGTLTEQCSMMHDIYYYYGPQSAPYTYSRSELNRRFRPLFNAVNKR